MCVFCSEGMATDEEPLDCGSKKRVQKALDNSQTPSTILYLHKRVQKTFHAEYTFLLGK